MGGLERQMKLLRIELLRGCPLACVHCSAESGPGRWEEMTPQQVETLLEGAVTLGAQRVVFTGGEPLEYPYLLASLAVAQDLGLHTTIYTTGITGRGSLKAVDCSLLKQVVPYVETLVFSFYSDRPEIHDKVTTVPGSWKMTLEAAEFFRKHGVAVNFSFLPLGQNWRDLVGVARLAQERGVEEIRVLKLMKQGRAARNRRLAEPVPDAFSEIVSQARQGSSGARIRVGGAAGVYGTDTVCEALDSELFVGVDGSIAACPGAIPRLSDEFSNCFQVGLVKVWRNSEYLRGIRALRASGLTCASASCIARLAMESADQEAGMAAPSAVS